MFSVFSGIKFDKFLARRLFIGWPIVLVLMGIVLVSATVFLVVAYSYSGNVSDWLWMVTSAILGVLSFLGIIGMMDMLLK